MQLKAKYEYQIDSLRAGLDSSETENRKLQNEVKTLKEKQKEQTSIQNSQQGSPPIKRQQDTDPVTNGQALPKECDSPTKPNGIKTEAKINQRFRGSEGT